MQVYITTPDKTRLLQAVPMQRKAEDERLPLLQVDEKPLQTMDGFGAALTDSSAWLLMNAMSEARREATLKDLFDPANGVGFTILRLPMGASDFSTRGSYTYNDLPTGETDPELRRFAIDHDRHYIVPLLRRILQIQPGLKIIASPWSAPAWMKTSKNLHGGWLDWPAYPAFARYFVRFVEAYRNEGIPIWAVTPQNEPRHETTSYPSMRMEPNDQARFIRDHLGPAFEKAGIKSKIFIWDHNWDMIEFPLGVLSDAAARRYIAGTAFHAYGGDPAAQARVRDAYPDKEIHFTEISGGAWATDFGANLRWDINMLMVGSVRYGSKSVLKWNLILDEKSGPQNGGCTNCRGVVTLNRTTGEVIRNEDYYALAHTSRFVKPGAVHLASQEIPGLAHVVFRVRDVPRKPSGERVIVGCNNTDKEVGFRVPLKLDETNGLTAPVRIPPGAVFSATY